MNKLLLLMGMALLLACQESAPKFERMSPEQTGIDFANIITITDSFNVLQNEYLYNGGGVGVGDLNQDGLQDLVFSGNHVSSRIYLNQGNFTFQDISASFQGLSNEQWFSGVAIVDINGDDLLDVYFTATNSKDSLLRRNRLWVNQGIGSNGIPTFTEQAEAYGIADQGYSVHAAFLDYDLDGDLDLYVLNNIVNKQIPTNYRAKITDGSAINNDHFYRNNGDGTFSNVTIEAGITYEGYGLGIAVGDVNKDGYPDIYVSNDYIANDLLYLNQQNGTFKNLADELLSYSSKFSMGNDMADINNDGNPDVMTLDMLPKVYSRKKQTINGNSYQFYLNDDKYGYQHQYVRNMVHLHSGLQGESIVPYREVGQMMGVFQTEWSWSPLFADVDNDGDRDLLITNGFPKDLTDKDFTNYKAQMYGYLASEEQVLARVPVVKVANFAYEQVGDLQFQDRTKAWGLDIPSFSNGASFVDLDNDGDLDYVVNNIDDPAFVYRNNDKSPGHFLDLKLSGEKPNTQAIGAKVEVWAGESYQFAELFLSRGYISSVSPVMHVGLGEQTLIDSVKVTWPGNKRQTFLTAVTVDQVLSLSQADSEPLPTSAPATHDGLFTKADGVITYTHIERDYIDFFQNQRILQHKFSQIGPCMAQGDINMDGLDDLVIGASDGAPTQVFLNLNGRFVWDSVPGISDSKVCSEADLVILDIDNDGDNDLIALAGGYATESDKAYLHYLYQNNGGSFERIPLPLPSFSASVVAPFDFDHDGDKDLFVGGRVVKGKFPQAPASYLLMNEAGTLAESGSTPFELGMVTDAIWSDYDQDGWEDLIITREWNSVLILKNNQGKGLSPASLPSLNQYHGLWTTIVAVDIDQDGDDDYVVGNLGQNHRFQIAEKTPMNLYAIDVDNNGTIDPITSAYWEDDMGRMTEYPVNYLDELAAQSPFFRQRFTSYTQFSQTSIPLIFKPDSISSDQKLFVNTTSHYLLRNEDGKFRWEELPRSVQVAPIKEMLVRDFTGDNIPDVLITGNDYSYDVSTGNYDANRGLILAGTAGGSYRVIPASESGLAISGQVESIAYIEGDTSFLMLGINRQKMAVYRVGN